MVNSPASSTTTPAGHLIVIEGLDGAGKTTLIAALRKQLRKDGKKVTITRWRESKIIGPHLRKLAASGKKLCPRAFSAIHAADLAERVSKEILPALRKGRIVLADRYIATGLARDAGMGISPAWSKALYSFAPTPDLTLHLSLPTDTAIARVRARLADKSKVKGKLKKTSKKKRAKLLDKMLGTLLGALGTTTVTRWDAAFDTDGNPVAAPERTRIITAFQQTVQTAYTRIFSAQRNVTKLDASLPKKEVLVSALAALRTII